MPTLNDLFPIDTAPSASVSLNDLFPIEEQPPPSLMQRATQSGGLLSPTNVGSLGGGILGGAVAGPPGAVMGAGLGAGLGRLSEQYLSPEGQHPASVGEALSKTGEATQTGMLQEMGGQIGGNLLTRGLQKILAPFAGRAAANAPMVQQAEQSLGVAADALPVSFQLNSPGVGQVEKMTSRFPVGSQMGEQFNEKLSNILQRSGTDFADQVAPGVSRDLSTLASYLRDARSVNQDAAEAAGHKLYDAVEQAAGTQPLPTPNLTDLALKIQQKADVLGGYANTAERKLGGLAQEGRLGPPAALQGLSANYYQQALQQLAGMGVSPGGELPFSLLRDIQSRSGALASAAERAGDHQLAGIYKQAYMAATDDIGNLSTVKPQLGPLLDTANEYWKRQVVAPFYERLPKDMGGLPNLATQAFKNAQPSDVVPRLAGPGVTPEIVEQAQRAVGPDNMQQAVAGVFHDLATRQAISSDGTFSLDRMLTKLRPENYNPDALEKLLGPQRYGDLQQLQDVWQGIKRSGTPGANPSGTGQAMGTMGQVFGIVSFASQEPLAAAGAYGGLRAAQGLGMSPLGEAAGIGGGAIAGALAQRAVGNPLSGVNLEENHPLLGNILRGGGVLTLTPPMLARVLFSPEGIRWLTKGLAVSPGTEEAARIGSQILARALPPAAAEASADSQDPNAELVNAILKRHAGVTE